MRDIKNFTLNELETELNKISESPFRAKQIFFWLYEKDVSNFDEMKNLPISLKEKLGNIFYIGEMVLFRQLKSDDGAEKFIFKLSDGNFIETVLIYARGRKTVCLSSQVGCKYGCSFCASGAGGFVRNLTTSEITGQILFLEKKLKHNITNYVFMGMGEPLDNYHNVSRAILIMNAPSALALGARRITLSTCGIIPGIESLKNLGVKLNLSVSLHAANDNLRTQIMPVNKKYPLEKLISACENFFNKTGRLITLEYILLRGENDSSRDLSELTAIAKRLKAKVNLIPYSPLKWFNYRAPAPKDVDIFLQKLITRGVKATLRESKGRDIEAACGQLAGRLRRSR